MSQKVVMYIRTGRRLDERTVPKGLSDVLMFVKTYAPNKFYKNYGQQYGIILWDNVKEEPVNPIANGFSLQSRVRR